MREMALQYGPEPHDEADGSPYAPAVALLEPRCGEDGTLFLFASVRGENTDTPSWSLCCGNNLSSVPIALDALVSLGVAQTHVVSSTNLGEFDRALTLCLDLRPGAVRPSTQYTVHLCMIGRGGVKARDSKTFFVESVH